ncbi:MAG: sodium:solute symporter family protein [Ignavibacteriota bacterium]|nr:sodium:solute symporter family protein [Ignavibacteriota bacterium]
MLTFGFWDYAIITGYFVTAVWIGFRSGKKDGNAEDYLVMGRRLTLPAFVATLVASFYGGILGVGEFTYKYGVSSWFLNAFPYYIFIFLFAIFLAKKIRQSKLFTIADKLELTYGKNVSIFGASMVFLLVTPAPYVFMLGLLTSMVFGFPLWVSMVITLVFSIIFLFKGGLNADVRVNVFEFILMFAGFGVIIPFCYSTFGGIDYLNANLPATHLSLTGGNSVTYILVWFFIGAWAIVDPGFHQRCYAAKDENTARKGIFISLIFWFIFDAMTTITGLYAVSSLKNIQDPAMSYPLLAESILPQFAKGFFFIGLLATIMSTLHSNLFISATTLGKDIIQRFKNTKDEENRYTKFGIVVTSLISLIIALLVPSVVQIWYIVGSLTIPSLLIGVVSSYFEVLQVDRKWIFSAMIVSFLFSLIWVIFSIGIIEPMYPGLVSGLMVYLIGRFFKKK